MQTLTHDIAHGRCRTCGETLDWLASRANDGDRYRILDEQSRVRADALGVAVARLVR